MKPCLMRLFLAINLLVVSFLAGGCAPKPVLPSLESPPGVAPSVTPRPPFQTRPASSPTPWLPSATPTLILPTATPPRPSPTPAPPTDSPTPTTQWPPPFERVLILEIPPMIGGDVRFLQLQLAQLGYPEVGFADAVYTDTTAAAVSHFQADLGLPVDGVVTELVWQQIFTITAVELLARQAAANTITYTIQVTFTWPGAATYPVEIFSDGEGQVWVVDNRRQVAAVDLEEGWNPVQDLGLPAPVWGSQQTLPLTFAEGRFWWLAPDMNQVDAALNYAVYLHYVKPETGQGGKIFLADLGLERLYQTRLVVFEDHAWLGEDTGVLTAYQISLEQNTSRLAHSQLLGGPVQALLAAGKRLWAVAGVLYEIQLADGQVIGQALFTPDAFTSDGKRLWGAFTRRDLLRTFSIQSGAVPGLISVIPRPASLAFDGKRLWILGQGSSQVHVVQVAP